jgi:hypothetical protein
LGKARLLHDAAACASLRFAGWHGKGRESLVFPVMKMRSKRNLGSAAAGLAGE